MNELPAILRSRFGLIIILIELQLTSSHRAGCRRQELCSWVIRPAALVFHLGCSRTILVLSRLMCCAAPCFLCVRILGEGPTDCFKVSDNIYSWSSPITIFLYHWSLLCFLFHTLLVPVQPPPPPSVPLCASHSSQLWLLCRWLFVGASQWF